MMDIYFDEKYGKLYERIENGECVTWTYSGSAGRISHMFIKREIPFLVDNIRYYDIITPYGYGGPYIVEIYEGHTATELLEGFSTAFGQYCQDEKIVSEFVRFYPLSNNGIDFKNIYDSKLNRYTLGTNLEAYDDPVQMEFSKSCRKTIRQVLSKGVTFRVERGEEHLANFIKIYYANMVRKEAADFYFFSETYFQELYHSFQDNILFAEAIYEDRIIAAGLYFLSNGVIHAHLSGTDTDYLSLSPAYILKYGTAVWGKENGYKCIHYGGGTSSSKEDPLYIFKKKFAANTEFPFYIGKKVWNQEVYDKLCALRGCRAENGYFPAYRN